MEKKKNKKLVVLVIAIVAAIVGISFGAMAALGMFQSNKTKAFELLKQTPDKICETSTGEYFGTSDMVKAMLDSGVDTSVKIYNLKMDAGLEKEVAAVLSKLQMDIGFQLDMKNKKGRMNLSTGVDDNNISLQAYASLEDQKAAIAVPELIANKVFTLGADEDSKKDNSQKMQEAAKQFSQLKDDLSKFIDEQGEAVYDGITCEKIDKGYRLTVSKEVIQQFFNSLSGFAEGEQAVLDTVENLCKVQKGTIAKAVKEAASDLSSGAENFSFDVLGEGDELTGLKAVIKGKNESEICCDISFSEESGEFHKNFTVSVAQKGKTAVKAQMQYTGTSGDSCKETAAYHVTDAEGSTLLNMKTVTELEKATNKLNVKIDQEQDGIRMNMTAEGSVKNLEKGKCVTMQYDRMHIVQEADGEKMEYSLSADVTEGVLDSEVLPLKGEEVPINQELTQSFSQKYGQEAVMSLFTILSKWGVDLSGLYNQGMLGGAI